MPLPTDDQEGPPQFEENSIFEPRANLDRGPNDALSASCEIKTLDRIMTLYSDDAQLVNKFTYYLQRIIELRDTVQSHLRRQDEQMTEMYR
jgi:hypothetical protein